MCCLPKLSLAEEIVFSFPPQHLYFHDQNFCLVFLVKMSATQGGILFSFVSGKKKNLKRGCSLQSLALPESKNFEVTLPHSEVDSVVDDIHSCYR